MRRTLLLVAALGFVAVTGPSALAQEQEQEKTTPQQTTPTPSEPSTQQPAAEGTTPAPLPGAYTQPTTPGQTISPYAPTGTATPCGYVMPSAPIPGTVMYGSQYQQYQPITQYGSYPQTMPYTQPGIQYAQPTMQYGQPTAMPVAGSIAGGVTTQPVQTGVMATTGMTYQPVQTGMVYSNGTTFQPGTVIQTSAQGTYSDQPVILGGYTDGSYGPVMTTTTQSGRRGLFGRRR